MYLELLGYGPTQRLLLRFKDMPYVHIFQQRPADGCFIDEDIVFPRTLNNITMQHDYLHEVRMHWSDAIYRVYYYGYLQAIQVHLGYKRVNGQPAKKWMQTHEQLLLVNYNALQTYRFKTFIDNSDIALFTRKPNETKLSWMERVDAGYLAYCCTLEDSDDEPCRVVSLFMKAVESMLRASYAVRNSNFWLAEKEAVDDGTNPL